MQFFVNASPYGMKIRFIISTDKEEVKAYGKKYSVEITDDDMEATAAVFSMEGIAPIVWLQQVPDNPKGYGEYFHEVQHACRHVGEYVGMKAEEIAGETFAYFIESVVVKSLTKIQKLTPPEHPDAAFSKN